MTDISLRRPKVDFYVQHLLGIGHLARAFRIAAALGGDGWDVAVLVGGELPPGFATGTVPVVQLPPVRAAAGGLSTLVHSDGRAFDAAAQAQRRDRLLAHVEARRPDVVLIEAFPFGRRQMRFELIPLLEMVRGWPHPPLVVASVRDILQESRRPERVAETVAVIGQFFDRVLVHGDPRLARLDDSFPAASQFADKIAYTGLVAPQATRECRARAGRCCGVGRRRRRGGGPADRCGVGACAEQGRGAALAGAHRPQPAGRSHGAA